MADFQKIIKAFALQGVKVGVFRANSGTGLETATITYPEQNITQAARMDTGAQDEARYSYLNTPVFADILLKRDAADEGVRIDHCLVEVAMTKNIVTTAVPGLNGTIKEYVNDGDYLIVVRGSLSVASGTEFPLDVSKELINRLQANTSLICVSPYLQVYEIFNIVIEGHRSFQVEGFQNMFFFEFSALSDSPIELVEEL